MSKSGTNPTNPSNPTNPTQPGKPQDDKNKDFNKDSKDSKNKEDPMSQDKQNRDTLGKDYDGPDAPEGQTSTDDEYVDPDTVAAGTPKDKKVDRSRY